MRIRYFSVPSAVATPLPRDVEITEVVARVLLAGCPWQSGFSLNTVGSESGTFAAGDIVALRGLCKAKHIDPCMRTCVCVCVHLRMHKSRDPLGWAP